MHNSIKIPIPFGSKNKAMEIWRGVIDNCEKRISKWKAQYLSFGERTILINSILDALNTYVMTLF